MIRRKNRQPPICKECGAPYAEARRDLGYEECMPCGELKAQGKKHCIVPIHKSSYTVISDREELKGINNKGGQHR